VKNPRSVKGVLTAALIVGLLGSMSFADAQGVIFPNIHNSDPGFHSILFEESGTLQRAFSTLVSNDQNGNHLCLSVNSSDCGQASHFNFDAILPTCDSSVSTDCIENMGLVDASGQVSIGDFKKYTIDNHVDKFEGDSKLHIPNPGMPGIWSIPRASHANGDLYASVTYIHGGVSRGGNMDERILSTSLIPVYLKTYSSPRNPGWESNLYYHYCRNVAPTGSTSNIQCSYPANEECILPVVESTQCYVEDNFPAGIKLNLKIRLSVEPAGWLHGRLIDPNIQITKIPQGTLLSISGQPAPVPTVYQADQWNALPNSVQTFWVDCMNHGNDCGTVGSNGNDIGYWQKSLR